MALTGSSGDFSSISIPGELIQLPCWRPALKNPWGSFQGSPWTMAGPHKSPLISSSELSFCPFPAQGAVRFTSLLHHILHGDLAHPLLPEGEEEERLQEQQIPPKHLDVTAVPQLPIRARERRRRQVWFLPLKILTDRLQAVGKGACFPRLDLGTRTAT